MFQWVPVALGLFMTAPGTTHTYSPGSIPTTLADQKTTDAWEVDDVVVLTPGVYRTGGLALDKRLVLQAADCVLWEPCVTGQYTLRVLADGVAVLGPLTIRNSGTNGGCLLISSELQQIDGCLIDRPTVEQLASTDINPIFIKQFGKDSLDRPTSAEIRGLILIGDQLPDGVAVGDDGTRPTMPGFVQLVDPTIIGCNRANNSNAVAIDTHAFGRVSGGLIGDSGGPHLIGYAYYNGTLDVSDTVCWDDNTRVAGWTFNAAVHARVVESCDIEFRYNGVLVNSNNPTDEGLVTDSRVYVDAPYWSDKSLSGSVAAVYNQLPRCRVQRTTVDWADLPSLPIAVTSGIYTAVPDQHLTVTDCQILGATIGVNSYYYGGAIVIERSAIFGDPTGEMIVANAIQVSGSGAFYPVLSVTDSLLVWDPAGPSAGSLVRLSHGYQAMSAENYFWHDDLTTPFIDWQPAATDTISTAPCARPARPAAGQPPTFPPPNDLDGDGVCAAADNCPNVKNVSQADVDNDQVGDACDACANDPAKTGPGVCGCGVPDTDSDADGFVDCMDLCPIDPAKSAPGVCGCGAADVDSDGDGLQDCIDSCPNDPAKTGPGVCGCGVPDTDSDADGFVDCTDLCPIDSAKSAPGICGCGAADVDSDGDGLQDCIDSCPNDPAKTGPGVCGCGVPDTDSDADGFVDCTDLCPIDSAKSAPGICGCGAADVDSDGDGLQDCIDSCPNDPAKTGPGICGCGVPDTDSDGDVLADCVDACPTDPLNDADGEGTCANTDHPPAADPLGQADVNSDGIGEVGDATSQPPPAASACGLGACGTTHVSVLPLIMLCLPQLHRTKRRPQHN